VDSVDRFNDDMRTGGLHGALRNTDLPMQCVVEHLDYLLAMVYTNHDAKFRTRLQVECWQTEVHTCKINFFFNFPCDVTFWTDLVVILDLLA
jgi:hypothetical protein